MVQQCKICGRTFCGRNKNNTLCSAECKHISKRENARRSAQKKNNIQRAKNAEKIIDINAEAKAMGMSYGRYVAYMSMKEGK